MAAEVGSPGPTRVLAGRDEEIAALARARQQTRNGQGQVIAVVGEAGIGKSALLRHAAGSDGLVVRFAPSAAGAWAPLGTLAAGLVAHGADPNGSLLGPYAAALSVLTSGGRPRASAPSVQPVEVAEALLRLWSTLPVPRRPLVGIEDVHWCDQELWAALEWWVDRAPALGLMVLLTTRPEGARWPAMRHLVDGRLVHAVTLSPLEPESVANLVAARLGADPAALPPALLDRVATAGGLPLLVEEVLDDLLRNGDLSVDGGEWRLKNGPMRVPATIEAYTRERLDLLVDAPRSLVRRAALMGGPLDNELLARSLGLDADNLELHLRSAADAGLLVQDHASGRAVFRHDLLRESVVRTMLDVQRSEHAAALLKVLGISANVAIPALDSAHLALACTLSAYTGARDLRSQLSLLHAGDLLEHGSLVAAAAAAAEAAELGGGLVRTKALGVRAEALALAGQVSAASACVAEYDAARAATGFDDAGLTGRVREAVVRATAHAGRWHEADRFLHELRSKAEPPTTTSLAALVALELGKYGEARDEAERVVDGSDAAAACEAMEILGRLARGRDLDGAEAWFRRAAERARYAGLGFRHAHAVHELATIAQLRSLEVAPLYGAREAAVAAGAPGLVGAVDFHLAALHGVRFEAEEALVAARRLLTDARSMGAVAQEAWAWILVGQAHAVAGHRLQAQQAGREARALRPDDREILGMAAGCCDGFAALLADDTQSGLQGWQEGVSHLRTLPSAGPLPPWYLWPILATVHNLDGDAGERARAETAGADLRATPGADALWHLATAVAAGRAGDLERARQENTRAEELYRNVSSFAGWWHLGHRWVALEAAAAGWGDPGSWMVEAESFFTAHDLHRLAGACRSLARKAGAPQRRRGRGDSVVPEHLARLGVTSREVDVLRLVSAGLTNKEVAERLFLSPRTVKGYVEQLLAKTSSANRTQLAAHLKAGGRER